MVGVLEERASRFIVSTHFCAWRIACMKLASERAGDGQVFSVLCICVYKMSFWSTAHALLQSEKRAFELRMRKLDAEVETLRTALRFQSQLLLPPSNANRSKRE